MIKIENRAYQGNDGEDDDHASYHLINNKDAVGVKLPSDFIHQPSQSKPPQQGTEYDAQVTHAHLQRHVGHDEGKLCESRHEEEHNQRIGEGDEERRDGIVRQRPLLIAALVHVSGRIALETIHAKGEQEQTAKDLEIELVLRIVDEIHHKAHAQSCEQGIDDVAASGTDTCHKTIPTPLVQSALDTQNTYWTHRGRGYNTYDNSLENKIKNIYL